MRISALVLAIHASIGLFAGKLDSLLMVYHDARQPDTIRLEAFRSFIWEGYLFSDPDSARLLIDSLYRAALRVDGKGAAGDACSMRGITYMLANDYPSAITELRHAEALFREAGSTDGVAAAQNNLGNVYWKMGDLSNAIDLYTLSLQDARSKQDSASMVSGEINVGLIYKDLNDTLRANEHWEQALHISEKTNDASGMAMAYLNLSTTISDRSDSLKVVYLSRAAEGFAEVGNAMYHGVALSNLGQLLTRSGRTVEAHRMIDSAMTVLRPLGDELLIRPRILLVELHLKERHIDEVIDAGEALRPVIDSAASLRDAMDLYNMLEDAYAANGNMAMAYARQKRFQQLKDSLLAEENKRGLLRSEYRYAYEQQAFTDSLEHAAEAAELALHNERILAAERSRRNIALALGVIMAVAGIGVWQRGRLLRRANAAILEAQSKLVVSEREREASEVRTRIARDVHDQLGSDLTKLVMLSTEAREVAKTDVSELPAIANDIERIAGEANRSLGDIVWAIDPHHDSLAGLTERVRAHCERMLKWSKVEHTIDCVHEGPDRSLDPATKRDIYLMLREALNNAIKYAHAKHISVRFHTSAAQVEFEVKDDGVGMDVDGSSGHGLGNMRARAERIGGSLDVRSIAGQGTRIGLRLTLSPV